MTTARELDVGVPIDPKQIARIEHVHRGFLYQHIYAARTLLSLRGDDAVLIVERDEDVEVLRAGSHVYVQVKVRADGLSRAEVAAVLRRFEPLRTAHANGSRSGTPFFVLATNARPRLDVADTALLPADVHLSYPGIVAAHGLPLPAGSITDAFTQLKNDAGMIKLTGLSPESLALKLVGVMNGLASGARDHRIPSSEIGLLCELIVEQLQSFPMPPSPYRPQLSEPELITGERTRIIAALSGAGKTAWASTKAMTADEPTVYFDVTAIPKPYLPLSLARELAARFIDDPAQRNGIIAGATGGIDVLRSAVKRIAATQAVPTVVVDNAHLIDAPTLTILAAALEPFRVVILAQPHPELKSAASSLQTDIETLAGWDDDTIAREVTSHGARADVDAIARLRRLTSGLPLFVATASRLASATYGGDVAAMCSALEQGLSLERTAQDTILERFVEGLSSAARDTMALLSLADVPLTHAEAIDLAQTRAGERAAAAAQIRTLASLDVVQRAPEGKIALHDAFRPLALALVADLGAEATHDAHVSLRDLIVRSLPGSGDVERLRSWMRLAAVTGDIDTLTDVALDEMVHQIGGPDIVRSTLESALDTVELEPSKRFDALDGLAFWDCQRGGGARLADYVRQMNMIADANELEPRQLINLASKEMTSAADRPSVEAAYQRGIAVADDMRARRVLTHNRTCAMLRLGDFRTAGDAADALVDEYLRDLGLERADLPFTQPPELAARMPEYADRSVDLQHLGDALHVLAKTKPIRERTLLLIQAMKFYSIAWSPYSLVRVGREVVDDFLRLGDPVGARIQIEQYILPVLHDVRLTDPMLEVRAQYAYVLGRAGQINEARALIDSLEQYDAEPELRAQIRRNREAIEAFALTALRSSYERQMRRNGAKVGRNDPCICGSGKKYKRCHGSQSRA